ncbi:predicted protein [Uncinocarpus reesii 1704]|uniref:Uncharacterized protein n=1 Tax=Uncinocarpus reesii (strain UAMH 1704) TaxID=336963 RepID=C4JMR5_UNCRE|nr:uncharacterized protein UREG_04123 [Uncinocarpus reesii 1704]EEP79277.1 predicted protein [Uncinocarpus reesii 1704]
MAPGTRSMSVARQRPAQRPVRSTRSAATSYKEWSDSDSDFEKANRAMTHVEYVSERKWEACRSARSPPTDNPLHAPEHSPGPAKKPKLDVDEASLPLDSGEAKPPWATLPYHILFKIFLYLSPFMNGQPVVDTSRSVKCLLGLSRLSRAFFDPAVSALYFSPPVLPACKLKGLLELLKQDQDSLCINYRTKIRHLVMDTSAKPQMVHALLQLTPQLKYLRFFHAGGYRQNSSRTIHSPHWLFCDMPQPEALLNLRLHSWEWNGGICLPSIKSVHSHPAFSSLQSVRFYHLYHCDGKRSGPPGDLNYQDPATQAHELASALALLPNLKRLDFTQCYFTCDLLPLLPMDLNSLSIVGCYDMNSSVIRKYLSSHGRHLHELVLAQNSRLDMSFAPHLGEFCPRLKVFIMDFNTATRRHSRQESETSSENLLSDSGLPTWPSTLQWLELQRLGKWQIPAAERLFNSIIDSAPHLRDLRTLIITAIIDVDWRDRARFRKHWMKKLERTFLRNAPPPSRQSARDKRSAFARAAPPLSESDTSATGASSNQKQTPQQGPKRRSNRIAAAEAVHIKPVVNRTSNGSPASVTSDSSPGETSENHLHGMCDVVKIRIDNLRPATVLLDAENISDDESGDSDWNGVDLDFDNGYAW